MTQEEEIRDQLGRDIVACHERFVAAMAKRLPQMPLEERERYFALLSPLVGRLEETEKPLRQVFQETAAQVLPILMQELSSR
jgi:uncharacterized membrane protein YccC